jgi:hypothetical protein
MDVPVIAAHGTPPHDNFGFEIEIAFNHPVAGTSPRTATASNPIFRGWNRIRMRGPSHDTCEEFGQSPGRARNGADIALLVEEMSQVGYPGSGHITLPIL